MNLLPTSSQTISAAVLRARLASRGLGQSNHSNTLGGEGAAEERSGDAAPRRRATDTLSQFGTKDSEPLWNGPRLMPAFVAQVLGQVMMDTRDRASALAPAAYRQPGTQIAPGTFFDSGN